MGFRPNTQEPLAVAAGHWRRPLEWATAGRLSVVVRVVAPEVAITRPLAEQLALAEALAARQVEQLAPAATLAATGQMVTLTTRVLAAVAASQV